MPADRPPPVRAAAELPKRIQRKRTKGWRMPEGAIYVGRPTCWGNPFVVGKRYMQGGTIDAPIWRDIWDRQSAVIAYRLWINDRRRTEGPTIEEIERALKGRDLACFCRLDQPCHADVLLKIANASPPA
jgi:hypothetical protein